MSDEEMASIALHLGSCAACRDQYEAFVLLSELEERDEMADF
jgi:predicted anti-sigma-YlaC factor YlaD